MVRVDGQALRLESPSPSDVKLAEATLHFQRALRIDPNHKLARENLEQISHDSKNPQE